MEYPFITEKYPLILASASPRRKELLQQVGLPFHVVASLIEEDMDGSDPEKTASFIAEKKARDVFFKKGNFWILGADTVVVIDGEILGKPSGDDDASRMLTMLSGKEHKVITGFCIIHPSGKTVHTEIVLTRVWIKKLTKAETENYIKTGEPFGKAGSYAIQGIGSFMVEGISGSYSNVVGLPLYSVINALVACRALGGYPSLMT